MLSLQQLSTHKLFLSVPGIKLLILVLSLVCSTLLLAKPQVPSLKMVHVGKYQDKTMLVPDERRFKNAETNYLEFDSELSHGYWIKPTLNNNQTISTGHLFTFMPKSLDTINMYIPDLQGDAPLISSSRFDINTKGKFSHRARIFEIPPEYKAGQDVYFYVSARNGAEIKMEYWEHDDYLISDREYSSIYSAVFASLFILAIINFIFYLAFKDKNYLRYVFYLLCFLVFIMTSSGKIYEFDLAKYLAANYNHIARNFALVGISLTLFVQGFLKLKDSTPYFYRFTQIIFAFFTLIFLASIFIWPVSYVSLPVMNIVTLFSMPIAVFFAIKLWINGNKQAKYFTLAFMPLFVMIGLRIFVVLGVIPAWKFALSGFQIAIVFQALILSLGLADKIMSIQKQRDEAKDQSKNVSSLLKNDKEFSMFLARVSADIRENPNGDHNELIVESFFARLSNLYQIKQGAIVSMIEGTLKIMSPDSVTQSGFESYVNEHMEQVARICRHIDVNELSINKHPFFSRQTKMLFLPVHMRGHEWSCMILNVDLTQRYSSAQLDSLQRYSTELIRTLVNAEKMKHFSIKSETDYLTQVLNRETILNALKTEINKLAINNLPLSIAFVDIDFFKKINDQMGHEAGDTCLTYLAYQIRRHLPTGSYVGRMGGDEFLFVLPNHNPEQAHACLSSIMRSLDTLIIDDQECSFTLSIGIAQYEYPIMDLKGLLRYADETLYKSKENGRNQITIAA